jgi:U3 small nucleolar RNA-associated protein 25
MIQIFIVGYIIFLDRDMNFGALSEYNSRSKTSKVRAEFVAGSIDIVLYTERFHFFRRLRIKGQGNAYFVRLA